MAEVEIATDTTILSKTAVEPKVDVVTTEETTVVEVNGDHKPEQGDTEVKEVSESKEVTETKENGQTVKEEEPTEVETKEVAVEAEVVEPEKEVVPPKVILHQFPPVQTIPSTSPFCLKIETFLRLHNIPYENQHGYKMGKKGKQPWIEYKGERKADSSFIIDFLNETFEINTDKEFSEEQLALGRAVKVMLEENTYLTLVYHRMENFNEFKKIISTPSAGIGFSIGLKMHQRKHRSQLEAHGMGRHSAEEVYQIAKNDIKAVSDILGNKDFLLGDKPSSFDCTVFGIFANVIWSGLESPLSEYVKESAKNLITHCERMKALCWIDWSDMVLGDKPEPIKKGFSFRRSKKPKVQKTKEKDSEEVATTENATGSGDVVADEVAPTAAGTEEPVKEETPEIVTETPAAETTETETKVEKAEEEEKKEEEVKEEKTEDKTADKVEE